MELNDLINFNTLSPISPLNENVCEDYKPRLSEVNNPFDRVLKKSLVDLVDRSNEERKLNVLASQNKETLNLISPLKTPCKGKNFNKINTSPLFLKNCTSEDHPNIIRKDLVLVNLNDSEGSDNIACNSFFDDSFINNSLNYALIETSNNNDTQNSVFVYNKSEKLANNEIRDKSPRSDFIEKLKEPFTEKNVMSFLSEHHSEITKSSNICRYNTMIMDDIFIMASTDSIFCPPFRRRSMSASKPQKPKISYNFSARRQLNRSICSLELENFDLEPILDRYILSRKKADGSFDLDKEVYLDNIIAPWEEDISIISIDENICQDLELEKNSRSTPIMSISRKDFELKKTDAIQKENYQQTSSSEENISPIESSPENEILQKNNTEYLNQNFTILLKEDRETQIEVEKNSVENENVLIENIKDFLHTKSKGVSSDEHNISKDFVMSLIKALHLEGEMKCQKLSKSFSECNSDSAKNKKKGYLESKENLKITQQSGNFQRKRRSSGPVYSSNDLKDFKKIEDKKKGLNSEFKENSKTTSNGNIQNKNRSSGLVSNINLKPKSKLEPIKIRTEKLQVKNLKLNKIENEKLVVKGPLKAVIPVKNMEKKKKSLVIKTPLQPLENNTLCTTPNVPLQPRRTSTALLSSIKPQAQSTPQFQKNPSAQNSTTPLRYQKRSSLPRPSSSPDINKSISPRHVTKNNSGSVPDLSVSGQSPSSKPTVKRRFSFNKEIK